LLNLEEYFPFPLDDFQLEAIRAINSGNSVVLTAPTGSGKTLIGEFAIYRGLSHESRVFYTTPLKALSNHKFRDFANQYGENKVGLLTGDISINREAPILVMTTEIFRNMLYGEFDEFDDPLENLESVILDECHYMNDPQRGTVWEETIIHWPTRTQIIALSATIANADQLQNWIEKVHGPTVLINSDKRPVPLDFIFCSVKGLHPLLNSTGEVIGINTLIRSGPGAGLSFAIPINKAKEIAYQLIKNGKVIHPMIGISLIEEKNSERKNNSVKVGYVVPNSPAEKSGIMIEDTIVKVGNKNIETASDVIDQISKNGINKQVNILLKRRNKFIQLKVIPTDITNLEKN